MTFLLVLLVKSAKCWKRKQQEKTSIYCPNTKSKSSEAVPDLSIHGHIDYTASSVLRLNISMCVYVYIFVCIRIYICTYTNVCIYVYLYMYSAYAVDRLVNIHWPHTE